MVYDPPDFENEKQFTSALYFTEKHAGFIIHIGPDVYGVGLPAFKGQDKDCTFITYDPTRLLQNSNKI